MEDRTRRRLLAGLAATAVGLGCKAAASGPRSETGSAAKKGTGMAVDEGTAATATGKVVKSDAEWKKVLTPQQYHVLREKGTERAFTGAYWNNHEKGIYVCAACAKELFSSETKFESGTGWPSFWAPISKASVEEHEDNRLFARRTEIVCARCGGHLGHVFNDGPRPTGLRYCMNSAALRFVPEK
jgi:peptide-methionine (R)-S-oxide reductase